MAERVPRNEYPWWVKVSMCGVPGRNGLWGFVALSVALAVGCVVYGFVNPRYFAGGGLSLFAALMYWLSIRWVDRYGSWEPDVRQDLIVPLAGAAMVVVAAVILFVRNASGAPSLGRDSFQRIKLGMSVSEVESIFGMRAKLGKCGEGECYWSWEHNGDRVWVSVGQEDGAVKCGNRTSSDGETIWLERGN